MIDATVQTFCKANDERHIDRLHCPRGKMLAAIGMPAVCKRIMAARSKAVYNYPDSLLCVSETFDPSYLSKPQQN
eukprot:2603542-Amphidinium_carterae.1